jgi:WD40 repeat protein
VAYASGGELIVSGSASAQIAVWDANLNGNCLLLFDGHCGPIRSICVVGEKIFSGSGDGTIRVWDLPTGNAIDIIPHNHETSTKAPINAISLTPDGEKIVAVSDDSTLTIFDSDRGEPYTLPLHTSARMFAVTVSQDGELIACGGADKKVHVWRANMTHRAMWPDDFIRKTHGLEYCLVDKQGLLANFASPRTDDGWIRGSTNERMFWVPSLYRVGLWTPRTMGILGAPETIVNLRNFVHGTEWKQCHGQDMRE